MNEELIRKYLKKIKILNETIWEKKATLNKINAWLDNFENSEKLHALYLLTEFIYFNNHLVRSMLISVYRDLYKYKEIEQIRKKNNDTLDEDLIKELFKETLSKTRFLPLGNISESSTQLLTPFRQLNKIPKPLFKSLSFDIKEDIEHFVFLDDFCGSGNQAVEYSNNYIPAIRKVYPHARISYFMMTGTQKGKHHIIKNADFDYVDTVLELDSSYKCFDENSRIFRNKDKEINVRKLELFCGNYGKDLMKSIIHRQNPHFSESESSEIADYCKYGYSNGQLLISFFHNTPDNTMPIFWYDEDMIPWTPIFKRYNKVY